MAKQSEFARPYVKVFKDITHWHEHEIHDRIGVILGIDTWEISTANLSPYRHISDPNYHLDLTINFSSKEDYEKCLDTILEVIAMKSQ